MKVRVGEEDPFFVFLNFNNKLDNVIPANERKLRTTSANA
jgi:hypothetical protein